MELAIISAPESESRSYGSLSLQILSAIQLTDLSDATPAMTCLMEKAAAELLEKLVPAGWTTVGISLDVKHKAPTPVGPGVRAEAEVTAVEGRKVTFSVHAFDNQEEIGSGTHERFAVEKEKFLSKASAKR